MQVPAVMCAVSLISETVGTLPAKLFDRQTRQALTDHPAYRLMHGEANEWTSAEALRTALTADALLHDKGGFAVVVRNGAGEPLELHRVPPPAVTIYTEPDGEPFYTVQTDRGHVRYGFRDVLHVQAFGGRAPITLAKNAIALAAAFESHIGKVFANGAQPGGIITSPKRLDETAKQNLKAAWTDTHSGPKAGGVALLDEGMLYQQVVMTLSDAQFAENRLEQIREIARAFRVPPTMLFELSRGTWSNTEEMARQFLQVTLQPWLRSWEWSYSRCLLTPEERREVYVEFVIDDLLSTSHAARAAAYGQYRSMGAMTANEVRAGLNLTPMTGGDVLQNPYTTTGEVPETAPEPKDSPNE
ncbi:MAG: phage portal protein [Rhodobacteraceae bacterium]|nr:phage portal protein [Paracoccaceae bacterium]MCF8512969.1 phage portal protein [Paracoccaceae bacterium]MCF8517214.1 phage portal protein [Paracoccaceae bacterium]